MMISLTTESQTPFAGRPAIALDSKQMVIDDQYDPAEKGLYNASLKTP